MIDMAKDSPIIAILGGTGKEGTGLALRWAAAGYKIMIGSRLAEKANKTADELNTRLGSKSVIGMENYLATREADICVLTVEHSAHQHVLESLKDELHGKILVDATSRVDYRNPVPPEPPSAAQRAQTVLGLSVRIVAAFQNVPAKSLSKDVGQKLDADILVCSDDLQAAEHVIQLAKAAGMRGYYAGGLANAIIVEGLTAILVSLNKHYGVKDASIKVTGIQGDR